MSGAAVLDGTIDMSGAHGVYQNCYPSGGGAGGSIWISVGTLMNSDGQLLVNGGFGATGSGHGGSGGRIALTCSVAHSYASDSWSDWRLRFSATGGGRTAQVHAPYAAPGTVYVDCGSRNRSLWVDNGVAGRTAMPAYVLDDATSYALREVRGTRGGTLTWLAMSGSNSTTVSVSALSGDASATLTLGDRVIMLLASR
ncbi:MAG: hypothetical protein EON93_06205, partial [Burkholderiales bacterium]